jgi:hypothetical protein
MSIRPPVILPTTTSATKPFWKQSFFQNSIIIIALVVFIGILSKWSENSKQYSKPFLRKVRSLIEQSTRWNAMAQQDTNPILQLIHCSYALSYAQMARNIVSDNDVETITGIDIHELIYYLEECQSYTIKNLGQQCPKIKIDGVYSVGSGWN